MNVAWAQRRGGERERMRDEVLAGLRSAPKSIHPKYLYDDNGARLFDEICRLPEYYPTRTELGILRQCRADIRRMIGAGCEVIEFGSGAGHKTRLLLEALRPRRYLPVDICADQLADTAARLATEYPWLSIEPVCGDYADEFDWSATFEPGRVLAFFPGSSIGNFEPDQAAAFLQRLARLVGPDGTCLVGVDLKKSPDILHAAYNDARGITAAFNLNLLGRLNRELGATFELGRFTHRAFFNEVHGRIEMHLISQCRQRVCVAGETIHLAAGEAIHTENSYKYHVDEFQALARRAALEPMKVWTDPARLFSIQLLRPASHTPSQA